MPAAYDPAGVPEQTKGPARCVTMQRAGPSTEACWNRAAPRALAGAGWRPLRTLRGELAAAGDAPGGDPLVELPDAATFGAHPRTASSVRWMYSATSSSWRSRWASAMASSIALLSMRRTSVLFSSPDMEASPLCLSRPGRGRVIHLLINRI